MDVKQVQGQIDMISRLPRWTPEQMERLLTSCPYAIEQKTQESINAQLVYEQAKHECQTTYARLKLESIKLKERKELSSEGDRDNWVKVQPDYLDSVKKEMAAKEVWLNINVQLEKYKDIFIAVRKFAGMLNDSENLMGVSQKYV